MSFFQSQYNSVNTILKNRDIKIQEQTKFAFSLLQSRSKLVSHIQVHLLHRFDINYNFSFNPNIQPIYFFFYNNIFISHW